MRVKRALLIWSAGLLVGESEAAPSFLNQFKDFFRLHPREEPSKASYQKSSSNTEDIAESLLEAIKNVTRTHTIINVVNGLAEPLMLIDLEANGVSEWNFTDVPGAPDRGEFAIAGFNVSSFNGDLEGPFASVTYGIGGDTNMNFTLIMGICDAASDGSVAEGSCLRTSVSAGLTEKYAHFPQGIIGFEQNQMMDFIIADRVDPSLPVPLIPESDEVANGERWMERFADFIGPMTWVQLTLACTHDTGTYDPVDFYGILYTRTQYLSVIEQLRIGTRVLDIRVGYDDDGEWIIVHGMYPMSYSLVELLHEVMLFIDETTKEMVMLDFHGFSILKEGANPDMEELKAVVQATLANYIIDYDPQTTDLDSTLDHLWSFSLPGGNSSTQRVLVSWNDSQFGPPDNWMWPEVKQEWFDEAADVETLYRNVTTFLDTPLHGTHRPTNSPGIPPNIAPFGTLYSTCIFTNNLLPLEVRAKILRDSPVWLHGSDNWSLKAHVIAQDFIPHSTWIAKAQVVANIIKGTQLAAGVPIGPLTTTATTIIP